MDTRSHSSGSAQPLSLINHKKDLALVAPWTTYNDMFRIACFQLRQIQESDRLAPNDLRTIFLDASSADATIEKLINLFERFYEQGCICERSADMPYSLPEGSSSRQLGTKLFLEALEAFSLALETMALIPATALSNYLEFRIARFSQAELELELELAAKKWDPSVKLKLDEIRNRLQFCQTINDAGVTLRVRAVKILLKLVQSAGSSQKAQLIEKASILLDQAESSAPAVAGHPSFSALRANIPVLRHLLAID
jgi:hypothetical protein